MRASATNHIGFFLGPILVACGASHTKSSVPVTTGIEYGPACVYEGNAVPLSEAIFKELFESKYRLCTWKTTKLIIVAPPSSPERVEPPYPYAPFMNEVDDPFEIKPHYEGDRCQIYVDLRAISGGFVAYTGRGTVVGGCIRHATDGTDGWSSYLVSVIEG